MTKRLMILVGCLCLALLTNLSFRVPTTVEAQAQAACVTATAPAFTLGVDKNLQLPGGGVLKDGDLFYLGNNNGIQFTTTSANVQRLETTANEASQLPIGYPNTINMFFAGTTPNTTITALSCLDSFWDLNFVLYGDGPNAASVAGDVYELFLQQPDGSRRITLATFTNTPDGLGTTVTAVVPGGDLSAVGHTPTTIGRVIPYELPGGTNPPQQRTNLITLALPMDGSVPNCAQLGITIRKAGGNGRAQIGLVNLVVTRGNATTATGTGIQSGIAGLRYPTARVCDLICPACPNPPVCDLTICFAPACDWCNRLSFPGYRKDYWVKIPNYNFGLPVSPYGFNGQLVFQALGCNGFFRTDPYSKMVAEYVAAQLSIQHAVPFWYPELRRQLLACHVRVAMAMPGMPAPANPLPATLSNGVTLTGNSSLQDLFDAVEWAAVRGNTSDHQKLLAILMALNNCKKD